VEDVVPGSYWLEVYGQVAGTDSGVWYLEQDITVPPPEDPNSPTPFDLGDLLLKPKPEQ
jgi:hypothetical protein